jgi:hypothetical protein
VAERLKIPLHMMFTMPWSATAAFPHPLARLTQYAGFENRLSYLIVDSITWLGVRDIINSFRKKKLKLPPVSLTDRWSGSMLQTNKVPFAYIWSPALVPKPKGAVNGSSRAAAFGILKYIALLTMLAFMGRVAVCPCKELGQLSQPRGAVICLLCPTGYFGFIVKGSVSL